MSEIVITEFLDPDAVEQLKADYDVHWDQDLWEKPDELAGLVPPIKALIVRNRTKVTAELLDAAPNVKVIGRLGVGLDNIDLGACASRGITVCPALGTNHVSVAEYVIATMLMLRRGSYQSNDRILSGEWPRQDMIGLEVAGRTIGLIGFGAIGQAVAERARALDMAVLAHDPFLLADDEAWSLATSVEIDELIRRSEIVSIHVPLTPDTKNLIDDKAIATMKSDAIVINTARGGIVDEAAVAAALRDGRLGGAALDVYETEPVTADWAARFADTPNLVLTPHIAGVTVESSRRISFATIENVKRVLEGNS